MTIAISRRLIKAHWAAILAAATLVAGIGGSLAACAGPSFATQRLAQENRACAEVGFTPGTGEHARCVDNLDAAMTQTLVPIN
ncbi:hypothetical protein FBZ89_107197 [Nitrospirillum amazonense]|uniref:Uncharacterized protein n=1 Tax=Nitrospirillum amazonense TaxID=28077 RepID=A0A560FFV8_9PROT|nr:hypothetical protein [Nitrospirillum amazonense]TWB20486.1 hypothetical protein FBZ89_107197 [Nitrospirillum amazonense]